MKRKLFFLIIIFVVAGSVILGLKFISAKKQKVGILKVQSFPQVSVFVDNKKIGTTLFEEKYPPGEYNVKLIPESTTQPFASWQGVVKISSNLLTFINAQLGDSDLTTAVDLLWLEKISARNAELSVATHPDGAFVQVDDQEKGISPITLSSISTGDHAISVSSPGFAQRTLKMKTTSGYKVYVSVKLALSEAKEELILEEPEASESAQITVAPTVGIKPTPSETEPTKPYALIKDTPTGYLRVRTEPSTSASEAARVRPGDKYTITNRQEGWFEIEYGTKKRGWISGQYADIVE